MTTTRIRKFFTGALWHGGRVRDRAADRSASWGVRARVAYSGRHDRRPPATRPGAPAQRPRRPPGLHPGRPAAARPGVTAYKISSNENPYPPLPSVLDVVCEAAGSMNRYPDMAVTALTAALAERLDVPAGAAGAGAGVGGGARPARRGDLRPGRRGRVRVAVVRGVPDPRDAGGGGAGAGAAGAPASGTTSTAMAAAITPRTRMVLVCTPNNPTGTTVGDAELEVFLEKVPSDVLVVIDEAYLEFVTAPDSPDALAVHRSRPNVAVLRTFSKAYGLAGLRVGYAVAHEPVAEALRKAAIPFGVNSLAQAAAVASLEAFDELEVRVKELVAERARVVDGADRPRGGRCRTRRPTSCGSRWVS